MDDIKIGFFIENADIEGEVKTFTLYLHSEAWKLSVNLNSFFLYPAQKVKKFVSLIGSSEQAPKGFGICKMCLDYLKNMYDNETIDTRKELKAIARAYKYIEYEEDLYHLFKGG